MNVYICVYMCMNETCHTYEWDMSHVWMRHVTRTQKSIFIECYSHLWTTQIALCHTHKWHTYVSFTFETGRDIWDKYGKHTCVLFTCVTFITYMWRTDSYVWQSAIRVCERCLSRHTYAWAKYEWRYVSDVTALMFGSFICVTWKTSFTGCDVVHRWE